MPRGPCCPVMDGGGCGGSAAGSDEGRGVVVVGCGGVSGGRRN